MSEALDRRLGGNAPPKITEEVRAAFLDLIEGGRTPADAAALLGVKLSSLYGHKRNRPEFAAQWEQAIRCGGEALISEAQRRGVEGWLEPVMFRGEVVAHVRKYSDRMLELLIKGSFPEKFNDRLNAVVTVTQLTADDLLHSRELARDTTVHEALEVLAKSFAQAEEQRQIAAVSVEGKA